MSAVAPLIPGAFIAALARRGDSHGGSLTCLATASSPTSFARRSAGAYVRFKQHVASLGGVGRIQ